MAWTAEIMSIEKQPQQPINIVAKCQLVNAATGETLPFEVVGNDLTIEMVSKIAALRIASVDARDGKIGLLSPGPIKLPDITPTPEEAARAQFQSAMQVFNTARQILPADHADIAKAQALMLDLYKPEYIGL